MNQGFMGQEGRSRVPAWRALWHRFKFPFQDRQLHRLDKMARNKVKNLTQPIFSLNVVRVLGYLVWISASLKYPLPIKVNRTTAGTNTNEASACWD